MLCCVTGMQLPVLQLPSCELSDTSALPCTEAADTEAPVVTSEDATVVAPNDDGAVVNFPVSATDNQDPNPVITCSPKGPGAVFPIGVTVVQCTATDASGNVSEPSFNEVTVTGALPGGIPMLTRTCKSGVSRKMLPFLTFATRRLCVQHNVSVTESVTARQQFRRCCGLHPAHCTSVRGEPSTY